MTELVWHYTNAPGLKGILESGTLRASSCLAMNDTSEIVHGFDVAEALWTERADRIVAEYNAQPNRPEIDMRGAKDRFEETLSRARTICREQPCFVACASLAENDLSQWRAYAAIGGFAIGIRRDARLGVKLSQQLTRGPKTVATCGWSKVRYARDTSEMMVAICNSIFVSQMSYGQVENADSAQEEQILSSVKDIAATNLIQCIIEHKHPSFRVEEEVRVIISDPRLQQYTNFRAGAYGITRYVEITWSDEDADERGVQANPVITASGDRGLPIEAIYVGPTGSSEASVRELRAFLDAKSYGNIEIKESGLPLR